MAKKPSMRTLAEKIARRLEGIPPVYRGTYRKAIEGKSLRAAVNAQCGECCGWQREEVKLCTDAACPLYAVRPYGLSHRGHDGPDSVAESSNDPSTVESGG